MTTSEALRNLLDCLKFDYISRGVVQSGDVNLCMEKAEEALKAPCEIARLRRDCAELYSMILAGALLSRLDAKPAAVPERFTSDGWLVWSNYHGAWWGPNKAGYYTDINSAGRYSLSEAERCARTRSHQDGEPRPEVVVPSPELMGAMLTAAPEAQPAPVPKDAEEAFKNWYSGSHMDFVMVGPAGIAQQTWLAACSYMLQRNIQICESEKVTLQGKPEDVAHNRVIDDCIKAMRNDHGG